MEAMSVRAWCCVVFCVAEQVGMAAGQARVTAAHWLGEQAC